MTRTETNTRRTGRHLGVPVRRTPVRRVPTWWRDASTAVFWGVLLFVTGLWVAGGGIQGLSTVPGALSSTGRLSGLIASALLLVQVFLMARVPWFEQAWGQDQLARTHRLVG
ncbi:MAG: oxidoreductase, partial [Pedococcus sp.]